MENFIRSEVDLTDPNWVDSTLAMNGHDHLSDMVSRKAMLIRAHALLHLVGDDDTEVHEDCLQQLEDLDTNLNRAWAGIYN